MNKYMECALNLATRTSLSQNLGGPFGACIVKDGEIISLASNTVLVDKDPTAHAEMNAIRQACKKLDTFDLSGCELYTTAYPCPMCLGAIMWSNIKVVHYGCTAEDTGSIGFRDNLMYLYQQDGNKNKSVLDLIPCNREECLELMNKYKQFNKVLY